MSLDFLKTIGGLHGRYFRPVRLVEIRVSWPDTHINKKNCVIIFVLGVF